MAWKGVIDEHRHLLALTELDPLPASFTALAAVSGNRQVSLPAFPANYRRGRVLSPDMTRCDDPLNTHSPLLAEVRRATVVEWARFHAANPGFGLRLGLDSYFTTGVSDSAILGAWVFHTLAAAGSDSYLLSTEVWGLIQNNISLEIDRFNSAVGARRSQWQAAAVHMHGLTGFYNVEQGMPARKSAVAGALLSDRRAFAESVMFGGGR